MLTHAEVAVSRKNDKKVEGACRPAPGSYPEFPCVPRTVPVLAGAASCEVCVCALLSGDTVESHWGMAVRSPALGLATAIFHWPLLLTVPSCMGSRSSL